MNNSKKNLSPDILIFFPKWKKVQQKFHSTTAHKQYINISHVKARYKHLELKI